MTGTITNNATATGTFTDSASSTDTATASATVTGRDCGGSQLLPTQTTCTQFRDGTAVPETTIFYGVKSGKINNVAPGVLF